jgi:hypothetical protein
VHYVDWKGVGQRGSGESKGLRRCPDDSGFSGPQGFVLQQHKPEAVGELGKAQGRRGTEDIEIARQNAGSDQVQRDRWATRTRLMDRGGPRDGV